MANTVKTVKAAEVEAEGKPVEFTYNDNTYTVAPADQWDLEAMESYEDGKMVGCIRSVLGVHQWATFKAGRPKMKDFQGLCEAMFAATGAEAGESEG